MRRLILPLLLALLGIAVGAGAGYVLRPAAPTQAEADAATEPAAPAQGPGASGESSEFVKLNNQFIVPDLDDGAIVSLVVLSLSLEVATGGTEAVYAAEPKLRDALLQVLFDHANARGFRGDFTAAGQMEDLRRALLEAARRILGPTVKAVLISDIARQDHN
ncbi:hypothetical protein SDC9_06529 [bioreactor metagenome]|uniref:Flagellar protein FliL n=1 Tax=bioreactor metagenome TaxID=1076179 RepID=A0A644T2A5_9ZZZZ